MFSKILEFIERHYRLSIIIFVFFCGVGVTLAASPNAFKYIFSSEQTVTSVDNAVIINTDLDHLDAKVKINSVKVDNDTYSIAYTHNTLDLDNGFWRQMDVDKSIVVDKKSLLDQNAGAYVAKKLVDDINAELASLKEIQAQEKSKGLTKKVVTTTYTGIVGGLLGSTDVVEENPSNPVPSNTNTNSSTSTTTPQTTNQQTLEEIINALIAQAQNPPPAPSPNPTPNSTPPSVAGPNPTVIPPPSPLTPPTPLPVNPISPTPAPAGPPPPNPSYVPTSGYMYMPVYPPYTESTDVANTGPLPQ